MARARVIEWGVDECGSFLCLDRTIFGPGHLGRIKGSEVVYVRQDGERIKHYFIGVSPSVGEQVEMELNSVLTYA